MKEQSSILKPNNKLVGVQPTKQEPKLPKPTGWRLLVLPFKMKEKTKGGVILAEDTLERQQVASQVGLVMAMGPQCYKDKERYLLNDDEVLATIDSPEDILHEF
jgi:hypothetical protein